MTSYNAIAAYAPIGGVESKKVDQIAASIKINGWIGCPILYTNLELITGSHRLEALKKLEREWDDFDAEIDCAEDVTDIVNAAFEECKWICTRFRFGKYRMDF